MDAPRPEPVPDARQRWVLILTSVASLMVALDAMVVSTALAEIGRTLGASIEALEWTVNAYTLTFAVLLMTAAALGDRFGRRRMFTGGLALFVVASAACALAPDAGWLIAMRALQGVGAAAVLPLALAQISAAFPPERRGWALGIYSSVTALSGVVGPVFGGIVTGGLSWPWIFWLNLPIGLPVILLAMARLPETFGPRERLDVGGLLLVGSAAFGLVWGLVRGNTAGWASAEVVAALLVGALLGLLFVAWERRAARPMVPMRLFALPAFAAGNAAMFLLMGALMGAIFFLAQFQQAVLGQGPLAAGLRLLPWGLALVAAGPRAVGVARRLGDARAVVLGLIAQAAGLAWLGLIASPGLPYPQMILPMALAGAGFALAAPVAQKAVVAAVPLSEIGKASGTLGMIRQLGGAFGVAVAVAAFAATGGRATPQAFSDGFQAAMAVVALLSVAAAVAAAGLPGRPRPTPVAAFAAPGGSRG